MKMLRLFPSYRAVWLFGLLLAAAIAAWPVRAQESAGAVDPPTRVGRLAEVQGEVWVYDNEEGEWVQAARNRPVTVGDRLSSAGSGRAEVRIGSTTLRIDANTEVEVSALDDDRVTLQLHSGDVAARLRTRDAARDFELVTREGTFRADRAGSYRFGRDDDTTEVTAYSGQLALRSADAGVTIKAGQRYRFWQDGSTQFESAPVRRDAFDDWVASRDDREERSVSARYVSAEMTGIEDLDRYGRWEQDREYGALWIPSTVSAGWAPYRAGHWAWISPWGWTWVDDAPWGFAPFHYGRWVSRGNVWCWSPGRYVARPVYAPALVAWIGDPGAGVSIQARRRVPPTVGWFPLGPREVYVPGHRFTPHYMRQVNVNQVPNGFNFRPFVHDPRAAVERGHYRYRGVPQAVTIVPRQVIERRQPVQPAIIGMNGRPLPGAVRLRPDAPVMPGGRPPSVVQRPAVQTAIPAAPGVGHERFGAPYLRQGDRQHPREPDQRWRDRTPPVTSNAAPQPGGAGRDDADRVRPGMRPAVPTDPGRPSPRDDRWHRLRPTAPQPEPQPAPHTEVRPTPQVDDHRPGGFNPMRPHVQPVQPQPPVQSVQRPQAEQPGPDAHRPGGFNHMRPHGQPVQPQPQPQAPAQPVQRPQPVPPPQVQAPPVQHARPQPAPVPQVQQVPRPQPQVQAPPPQPMPAPQAHPPRPQPQPQPQAHPAPQRGQDEGPRHRRMD